MKYFNKKVIAIMLVAAMAVPFVACTEDSSSSSATLDSAGTNSSASSIDDSLLEALLGSEDSSGNVPLVFTYNGEVVQAKDATSSSDDSSADDSSADDSSSASDDSSSSSDDTSSSAGDDSSSSSTSDADSSSNGDASSTGDYTSDMQTFQALWYDISNGADYFFEGELITVTFKVKDTAPDGVYDIDFSTLDFSNYAAATLTPDGVAGSIAVGQAAEDNSSEISGNSNFLIYGSNESAEAGDTVTYVITAANNPGIVAVNLWFEYDANALEIVEANYGSDFSAAIAK